MTPCKHRECPQPARFVTVFVLPYLNAHGQGIRVESNIEVCSAHKSQAGVTSFLKERQWDDVMAFFKAKGMPCTREQVAMQFLPILGA